LEEVRMSENATAKLFTHGRSQAVRLPKAFRLPGKEVRVRRLGNGVLLEPIEHDAGNIRALFAKLARYHDIPFMEEGRQQPPMPPPDDVSFD
jgi:antitoxin VapB